MNISRKLVLTAAAAGLMSGLAACGRVAPLEQPAPLFGAQNKADYAAHHAAQTAAAQHPAQNAEGSVDRQLDNTTDDPNADDAPLTTRDVKDPETQMTSPRDAPIPGAPNHGGPTPSVTPE